MADDQIPTRSERRKRRKHTALLGPIEDRKRLSNQVKRDQALSLRIQGATISQIANQLGQGETTIRRYIDDSIKTITADNATTLKVLATSKLDAQEVRMNALIQKKTGSMSVIEAVRLELALVKIAERRAKLEGTDAPTRTELTGRGGGPLLSLSINDLQGMTDEQLERHLSDALRGGSSSRNRAGDEEARGSEARGPHGAH